MDILGQAIADIETSIDAEAVASAGYKLEAVKPLLQLIERHPTAYFGDPGAIVHFIEQFGTEYEAYLVESLKRTPAVTTVWMLNRCINAGTHREALLELMRAIADRADAEGEVRNRAQEYVAYQEGRL